jgi:lysophospholipase L1-like esterase
MTKPVTRIIIACLGDSLTDGYPAYSCYDGNGYDKKSCYQYWLRERIHADFTGIDLEFINRGICGEITAQIEDRLYPEVIGHRKIAYGRKPDMVLIVGGTNDLGWGIDTAVIVDNIKKMHNACKKEGIISIGATIPPSRYEAEITYGPRKQQANTYIREFLDSQNLACADLFMGMGDPSNHGNLKPAYDAGDGLHFSAQGYRKMGEVIYEEGCRQVIKSFTHPPAPSL